MGETVAVGAGVMVLALLYRYEWVPWNWEALIQQAVETWGLSVADVGPWFSAWAYGDGQVFAVIASDPLGLDEGWLLGHPAYRYGRAGFGWLTWMVSLGQEQWIPYAMALIGASALVTTFVLAAKLRPTLGPGAWLIVLNPAVLIGFAGDTAETLGVLTLAWALATNQWWASAATAVIRPTFLVALAGRWRLLVAGVGTAAIFGVLWIIRFGFDLTQYGGGLGFPFVGYVEEPSLQSIGLALSAVVTVGLGWRHQNWGWVACGIFILCFAGGVVESAVNGWRAAGMLFVLWAFGPNYSEPIARTSSSSSALTARV